MAGTLDNSVLLQEFGIY